MSPRASCRLVRAAAWAPRSGRRAGSTEEATDARWAMRRTVSLIISWRNVIAPLRVEQVMAWSMLPGCMCVLQKHCTPGAFAGIWVRPRRCRMALTKSALQRRSAGDVGSVSIQMEAERQLQLRRRARLRAPSSLSMSSEARRASWLRAATWRENVRWARGSTSEMHSSFMSSASGGQSPSPSACRACHVWERPWAPGPLNGRN